LHYSAPAQAFAPAPAPVAAPILAARAAPVAAASAVAGVMGAPRTEARALGGPGQHNRAAFRQRGLQLQAASANSRR
jgi:hypothetical protein